MNPLPESILDFLVEAKQQTYASQGDDASITPPQLAGSRQLEYRRGSFLYRDIYFGVSYFVGQEIVYKDNRPYWSMSYAGGVEPAITNALEIRPIYAFLREALSRARIMYFAVPPNTGRTFIGTQTRMTATFAPSMVLRQSRKMARQSIRCTTPEAKCDSKNKLRGYAIHQTAL